METVRTVTIGKRGQVTIPSDIRRALGLEPGDRVQVGLENGKIILKPRPEDLLEKLRGSLKDGPSLTEILRREHAEEIARDERRARLPMSEW